MKLTRVILIYCLLFPATLSEAQELIPANEIIETTRLADFLKADVKKQIGDGKVITEASLALYFRQKFSERFYYNWQTFQKRFDEYNRLYNNQALHENLANDHMKKFADSTQWLLPFNYLNGKEVNTYALRHLARQHKMVDIAFKYHYDNKDPKYIKYFVKQMQSLNTAFEEGKYEKIEDGNGVYEVFRSGYRIINWLGVHNMFLGQEGYSDKDQLVTTATLLQHGAHLYERNPNFRSGNHQTRGMSALAVLSILFRDFEGTDLWYQRAMTRLEEHILKEINNDGFQFERSVHYHMSDIENYFYVYRLAQISKIDVGDFWEEKLKSLFTTLVKIAYPDKSAPVLQDDTEIPWAEKNDISGRMTLGYLLFEDPELGYFANKHVHGRLYWFLQKRQLVQLESISRKKPEYGSLVFPETKYYIMREGWGKNNKMMIISAGLDDKKPDHQHGDMLGIQAMANGQIILPNYQVRYSLPDYDFFKNSMVKNVALVDDELQGKKWTPNPGRTGFGKFKDLPEPSTIVWQSNDDYDFFAGSHNGFNNVGVKYTRQVIYVKNDFWIVKDNFHSDNSHVYKQVWQGHYTTEQGPNLLRSVFPDASGFDIHQLINTDKCSSSGTRGKQWTVVSKDGEKNFNFVTIIYPYSGYTNRIAEDDENPIIKNWKVNDLPYHAEGNQLRTLTNDQESFLFNVKKISLNGIQIDFSEEADLFVKINNSIISVHSIGVKELITNITGSNSIQLDGKAIGTNTLLRPGSFIEVSKNE